VEVGGFEPPSENILASASTSLARVFFLGPRAPTGRIAWAQAPQVLAPGSGAGAQGASLLPSRPAIPRRRGDRGRPTPSSGRKRERKRSRHLFCRPVVLGANGSSACYLGLDVPVESGHPHSYRLYHPPFSGASPLGIIEHGGPSEKTAHLGGGKGASPHRGIPAGG